jgi:hypothetical protein
VTAQARVCTCGVTITSWVWRDPNRCVACYLNLKIGDVIVCTAGDVRVSDCMPGSRALREISPIQHLPEENAPYPTPHQ